MNNFGIIYRATNKVNGKVYIGQTTKSLELRVIWHNKTGHYFHNAIKKYRIENFTWEIIEHCDSREELNEMEFHYIKQYNSFGKNGYNLTYGGDGCVGHRFSEKEKKSISESLKKYYSKNNNPFLGKKHSDKTKKKIANALKGRFAGKNNPFYGKKHTKESRKRISKALLETENHPNRGKHLSEDWRNKISLSNKGKVLSKECRAKISKSKLGKFTGKDSKCAKKFVITKPDGNNFVIHGLAYFSRRYKNGLLDFRLLSAVAVGKRNHHKGYKCRYYDESVDGNLPLWEITNA